MDTTLKDMLISLKGSLRRDMVSFMTQVKAEVSELGDRVHHIENKME